MGCTNCSFNKIQTGQQESLSINFFGSSSAYDWLKDLPNSPDLSNLVEVRFKDNRKVFYRNTNHIALTSEDLVTVQAPNGFDVGIVSLQGSIAEKQYERKHSKTEVAPLGIIYRKANENDLGTWIEAKSREKPALIKSREIAVQLNLEMKISDVEFQGDNKKATFYYISDSRVDFREMLKLLMKEFNVKIEMKQIGARQEASKIGGIGSCGKELCCSTWRNQLPSVKSTYIQTQQLSSGMEKYTGQCGKLKCCLMYELDTYIEAKADFPKELLELETKKGIVYPGKIDLLKKTVWYSYNKVGQIEVGIELTLDRIKEVINLNKRGIKVEL